MKRLNDTWSEKDGKIFCSGRLLRGVDAKSFRLISDLWATDGKDIYDDFGKVKSIKHSPSFCSISGGRGSFAYGVDDVAVYYKLYWAKTQELRGVDRKTASWISEGYLKDRKSVWFEGTRIKKADPDSFEVVSGTIGLDKRSAYFTKHEIEGACPEGFRRLHGNYIRCANGVWYQNERVPVTNLEKFEKFRYDDYGTDGESIFYQYKKNPSEKS
jgi:hypothetical protein